MKKRREWDSNPRGPKRATGSQGLRVIHSAIPAQPLSHKTIINLKSLSKPCSGLRNESAISGKNRTILIRARSLAWIRTLACGAGDPGFKSQRARQKQTAFSKSSLLRAALLAGLRDRPGTVPDTWGGPSYGR